MNSSENTMLARALDKHFHRTMLRVAFELLDPRPILPMLYSLAMAWASYFIIASPIFAASDAASRVRSDLSFLAMEIVSALALILMSTKSGLPAVLLWITGIALAFAGYPAFSMSAFLAAVVSTMIKSRT